MKVEILIGRITQKSGSGNIIWNYYQLLPVGHADGEYFSFKARLHDNTRLNETLPIFIQDIKDSVSSGIVEYAIENGAYTLNGKKRYAIDPMSDEDVEIFTELLKICLAR